MSARGGRVTRFGRDTGGAIAVMTALLMPVLIGIAAYAIDASLLLYRQERVQIAADIGARAGGELLARGDSAAHAIAMAEALTAANVGANAGAVPEIAVNLPDPDRIAVDASLPVARIFSQLFGDGGLTVVAGAVAEFTPEDASDACVYLDDPDANRALRLRRDSRLALQGCTVAVASTHGRSVRLGRNAVLEADCLDTAGGISGRAGITLSDCAAPRTGVAVPVPDIFAGLPAAPGPDGPCTSLDDDDGGKGKGKGKKHDDDDDGGADDAPARITPAGKHPSGMAELRLCDGLEIDRDTTGGPGLYFIADDLEITDGATLTLGPGAVLVLLDEAEIDIDSDARLAILPPDTGAFAGIAMMGGDGRDADDGLDLDIDRLDLPGMVIFPGVAVEIAGRNADAGCLRIHAGRLELDRRAVLAGTCDDGRGAGSGGTVRLLPNP